MKHERHCVISPTKHIYSYCPKCGQYNTNEKWRLIYCSENCKEIHRIIDDAKTNKLTLAEAYSELSKCNLPNMEDINEVLRPIVKDVLTNGKPKKKKKIVNEIKEPATVE